MELIIGGRQSGKTTKLIEFAHGKTIYIVCANRDRVWHIQKLAKKLNKSILHPITITEFLEMRGFYPSIQFAVDEIIDCFEQILRGQNKTVLAANLSSQDEDAYQESALRMGEAVYWQNQIGIRDRKISELQEKIKVLEIKLMHSIGAK